MKTILFFLLFTTACSSLPKQQEVVQESNPIQVTQKEQISVKPVESVLVNQPFDEIHSNNRILHIHSKNIQNISDVGKFWWNFSPIEFNQNFPTDLYTTEGNNYIFNVCAYAANDKAMFLNFLSYDTIVDEKNQQFSNKDLRILMKSKISSNTDQTLYLCHSVYKDVVCKDIQIVNRTLVYTYNTVRGGFRRVTKTDLYEDVQSPYLDEGEKLSRQSLWYQLNFCESVLLKH